MNYNQVISWLDQDSDIAQLKQAGLWSDIYRNTYTDRVSFIAAEHTAQQQRDLLRDYVERFKDDNNYTVNVLNCSTTMEMGVDIGSIDVVVMNSVPPAAANYLQRAGRAGRSRQTRALALTMCNATPIGIKAFSNPMWALTDATEMKDVRESKVIIQRHINSFFLHYYLRGNQQIPFDVSFRLGKFFGTPQAPGLCDSFLAEIALWKPSQKVRQDFANTFGGSPLATFDSIDTTRDKITELRDEYWQIVSAISNAYNLADQALQAAIQQRQKAQVIRPLQRRVDAIAYQLRSLEEENALVYLSKNLFLPNANMPTGLIEFDYADLEIIEKRTDLYNQRRGIAQQIANLRAKNASNVRLQPLRIQRSSIDSQLDKLKRITTRDAKTALNEYAPGQTVVIDEQNYVSAGLKLYGDFNQQSQRRFIYHCESCGRTEYLHTTLQNSLCPDCNVPYRSIIKSDRIGQNTRAYASAYEPLAFRVDGNVYANRTTTISKIYYYIQAELTGIYRTGYSQDNMVEFSTMTDGKIIYYNVGDSSSHSGFAVCKKCGRSMADHDGPLPDLFKTHANLIDGNTCTQNPDFDIERHVVFTACHPTCYTVLRLYRDALKTAYIQDESTIRSLGVILKRAIVEYLGIGEGEVDFGVKKESQAMILFFFDTNKGGSGYSTVLGDNVARSAIFKLALHTLRNAQCTCDQQPNAACTCCLVDRNSMHFASFLSKKKAMRWLEDQLNVAVSIPNAVQQAFPTVVALRQDAKTMARIAAANVNVTEMSFFVSSRKEIEISDWSLFTSEMGCIMQTKRQQGHTVNICIEYDPAQQSDDLDMVLSLCRASDQLINYNVIAVKSLGQFPPLLAYRDLSGDHLIFTDQQGVQPFSAKWSDNCINVFQVDIPVPALTTTALPTFSDLQQLFSSKGKIILEHDILNRPYFIGSFYSDAVVPSVFGTNSKQYSDLIKDILENEQVAIEVSDPYIVNGLSARMLYFFIQEFVNMHRFTISSLMLKIQSEPIDNLRWRPYSALVYKYYNESERDDDVKNLFANNLPTVAPRFAANSNHHRYFRFRSSKGIVEIRPDHGIGGGWSTNGKYNDPLNSRLQIFKSGKTLDTIYYIIIDKH